MGAVARQPAGGGERVRLKALLFDIDGTLVDSDPIHIAVFIGFLAERGVTITAEDYIARIHGRQNVQIFGDLLPGEDPHAMDLAKEAAYRERLGDRIDPMPGARNLIGRAKAAGLKLGAVTNGPRANLDAALSATGLVQEFDHAVSSTEVARGKPAPDLYLNALAALGVSAAETLVFEDSPSGIASARAAGIEVVGVASSLSPETLVSHGARFAIADFNDPALKRHLDTLEGAPA